MLAAIDEDFRARSARTGLARRPEIVGGGDADDLVVGQAGDLLPKVESLVVVVVDRYQEPIDRKIEGLGDQRPGKFDCLGLEIIAEREVAEHLEERVVARRIADVVEIVVLAAGAHAFLRGRRAGIGSPFVTGENVLERHHPGGGEHQGRVVARNQRCRRDDLMRIAAEIVEKRRADLVDAVAVHDRLQTNRL